MLGALAMPVDRTYHPNGQLRSEQPVVGGKPHGVGHSWYPSGQMQSETPFRDGIAHGLWKHWAIDGRFLGSFEMIDGTGTFCTWFDDGRPKSELSLVRGLPTGRLRAWDEAGELTEEFRHRGRKVSRKRYQILAAQDSSLPKYD